MLPILRPYRGINPSIGNSVYLDPFSCIIGDVSLADDVGIWPMCVLRGDVNKIKIGKRTNVQDGSVLHTTSKSDYSAGAIVVIGEDVTVGHKAMLHSCQIGDRVLIGMGAIILDHAIIENDVIVGAGSLVPTNKRLESGYLYIGSPAKQVRKLTKKELVFLKLSAAHYVALKNEYLEQLK
ncbi:MAG: gamma carbonic anhydrase family protein [Psychromonas sp.]|nr:gamma carbonic anhydrase family protein [Psychromonas sp.]